MGAEGAFQVAVIEACPPIEGGAARIVTGVYAHRRGMVYDLRVAGVVDPIGVTALHPFWSVDRNDWIAVSELLYGERLAIEGATGVVLGVTERGEEPVFNLEVDADHCYRVGEQGILVHNQSEKKTGCSELGLLPNTTKHFYTDVQTVDMSWPTVSQWIANR